MIAETQSAAKAWMDADPSVRLVYDGTTTEAPGSGNNVIGFGVPPGHPDALADTEHTPIQDTGPDYPYTGFDIVISKTAAFTFSDGCDPANSQPCTDDSGLDNYQGIITHEFGHVLGLAHPTAQQDEQETMFGPPTWRHCITLALGDVLGVRRLYPTDAPMPTLYGP
jgi:hypothetical protein